MQVYRNYKVLVLHSVDMMSATSQILVVQAPIWAAALSLLWPSVAKMDFELNRCVYCTYMGVNLSRVESHFVFPDVCTPYLVWVHRSIQHRRTSISTRSFVRQQFGKSKETAGACRFPDAAVMHVVLTRCWESLKDRSPPAPFGNTE